MREIPLLIEDVKIQFPDPFQDLKNQIRKSRSKHKEDPIDTFEWFLTYVTQVTCSAVPLSSLASQVAESTVTRTAYLGVKKGRGYWTSVLPNIPPQVQVILDELEEEITQDLDPQGSEEELQKLLKELTKQGGFFGVGIKN